jgi:DNA-binding MarR family transcriptional regulator
LLKEFVTREVCPENRRKIEVTITQKGLDVLKELDPKVTEHEEAFSKNLNEDEIISLIELLEKYRNQIN